jgi:hypothetical protein
LRHDSAGILRDHVSALDSSGGLNEPCRQTGLRFKGIIRPDWSAVRRAEECIEGNEFDFG